MFIYLEIQSQYSIYVFSIKLNYLNLILILATTKKILKNIKHLKVI